MRIDGAPSQPYVQPGQTGQVSGTEAVGGGATPPKVVDRLPPSSGGARVGGSYTEGLPAPRMTRDEALIELDRVEAALGGFDFSQPLTETSFAEMAQIRDMLMALMLKLRSSEWANRDAALQTMIKERLAGIEKGLDAAKKELAASLISGFAQVGGGLVSVAGGVKALNGPKPGLSAGGADPAGSAAWSQGVLQVTSGVSQATQGVGSIAAAPLTYAAKQDEADKARRDLDADIADKNYQQSMERMGKLLDDFKAQLQAEQQAWDSLAQSANKTFA